MISPIKKIVVNIDFSAKSLNTLYTSIQMCQRHAAELHLLYVMDSNQMLSTESILAPIAIRNEELIEKDIFLLKELARSIQTEKGIVCVCHQKSGFPVLALCEVASEIDCDLVVVPTENRENSLGYLFDSEAYRILKNVGCSVLAVPAEKRLAAFKNIIFPVRAKKDVTGKYNFSRAILKLNDAKVVMTGLLHKPTTKITNAVKEKLAQFGQWMREDNIPYITGMVASLDPTIGAKQNGLSQDPDLVIINASAKRNLIQFFAGNFTQRMLSHRDVAVLCYQPKRKKVAPIQTYNLSQQFAIG